MKKGRRIQLGIVYDPLNSDESNDDAESSAEPIVEPDTPRLCSEGNTFRALAGLCGKKA